MGDLTLPVLYLLREMEPLLEVRGAARLFGKRLALDAVDLEVRAGEIVGLVGPNGSGKTTLLRLIAGLLRPSAGSVRVFGLSPSEEPALVMERARFAFAPPALFETLTAREHLVYLTRIRSEATRRVSPAEIDRTLDLVGLADRADDRVWTYSLGMRQRLVIAQALLPLPELLVLDEPTDGLDPLAVLELRSLLSRLRGEHGVAVLLSSHLLIEIEELVDRMLVLREGRTLFQGSPAEMLGGPGSLRLTTSEPERAAQVLKRHGHGSVGIGDELELEPHALSLEEAVRLFEAEPGPRIRLTSFRRHLPSLEEALLARLREDSQEGAR